MFRISPVATAVSVALAASTFGISPQVLAQEVEEDDEVIEEIVTTGSRISRDAFSSATPIDVILTQTAQLRGISDVAEMLQTTTIAAGSPQITPAESTAFVRAGDGGVGTSTLSLRGLGASRTLSLLNGRRAGPAGTRGGVSSFDLNVIPIAALERIEILKDGASSIYGSDAVAGVVNFITKKGDGATIDAYTSQTSETGGEVARVSASFGKTFSRGNFRVTGDYYRHEELEQGDRDYLNCGEDFMFDPVSGARRDRFDPRTNSPQCRDTIWGQVWLYDYNWVYGGDTNIPAGGLAQFDFDGDLGDYIPVQPTAPGSATDFDMPAGWYMVRYDRSSDEVTNTHHPMEDGTSIIPLIERSTFFGDAEFDLTDSMTLYAEALLNRRETTSDGLRQFWGFIYNYDSGGVGWGTQPSSVGWTGFNVLSPTPVTDHFGSFIQVDYSRYLVGIRGDITDNWSFDLNYQHSKSDGSYTTDIIFQDSIDSNDLITGSCVGTVTAVRGVPCQDIPWLDPAFLNGDISPAMQDFLFGTETGNTEYTQSSFEGFVTGDLFELPAGTVKLAFGLHHREDEILDTPGEASEGGNSWGLSSAGITAGKDTTNAVFAEFDVPLVADNTGFKQLTLNVSARYTDVDSYGGASTYRAGLNWQVHDSLRLRANYGTSFRTPALFELYLAEQTSFGRQSGVDPCIRWGAALDAGDISQQTANNCAATMTDDYPGGLPDDFPGAAISYTAISSGGLGLLEAEASKSTTVGIIWTPEFADFSISLDHFSIQVNDQVDQLGGSAIVRGCYASEFFPDDPLCNLFDRSIPGSGIDNIQDSFINVATQKNSGWDLAARYTTDLAGGTLIVRTQHTWQDEAKTALFAGFERDSNGWFGDPRWVGTMDMTYIKGDWIFFWGVDVIGNVDSHDRIGGDLATVRGETVRVVLSAESVDYHDFSVSKVFDNGITVVGGMSNAFDTSPPQVTTLGFGVISTLGASPFYSQYDYLGRRWFVNIGYEFQ